MSETSVADDELRAFVERVERPADRLDYVLQTIEPCRGISTRVMHRAFNLASIVLGVDYEVGKACIRRGWNGGAEAISLVGPLSINVVGWVYWARSSAFPGAVKIGFSRDLNRRAAALSTRYGAPVTVERAVAGTMLNELVHHCLHQSRRIEGEWFSEAA